MYPAFALTFSLGSHISIYCHTIWHVRYDQTARECEGMGLSMCVPSVHCLHIILIDVLGRGRRGILRKRLRNARTYQVSRYPPAQACGSHVDAIVGMERRGAGPRRLHALRRMETHRRGHVL